MAIAGKVAVVFTVTRSLDGGKRPGLREYLAPPKAQAFRRQHFCFYDCSDADRGKLLARVEGFPGVQYSRVNPVWRNDAVLIVAGGPSVDFGVVEKFRGKCRVIAVNNSYTRLPWADLLYFADARWYGWHRQGVRDFAGYVCTVENREVVQLSKQRETHSLVCGSGRGLSFCPDMICTGANATYQAINVAVLAGAKLIITMGLDMRYIDGRHHWHAGHPVKPTREIIYRDHMIPRFQTLVAPLRRAGVTVLNASPGSALNTFPIIEREEALSLL